MSERVVFSEGNGVMKKCAVTLAWAKWIIVWVTMDKCYWQSIKIRAATRSPVCLRSAVVRIGYESADLSSNNERTMVVQPAFHPVYSSSSTNWFLTKAIQVLAMSATPALCLRIMGSCSLHLRAKCTKMSVKARSSWSRCLQLYLYVVSYRSTADKDCSLPRQKRWEL